MHQRRKSADSHSDDKEPRESAGAYGGQDPRATGSSKPVSINKGFCSSEMSLSCSSSSCVSHSSPKRTLCFRPHLADTMQKKVSRPLARHYHEACSFPPSPKYNQNSSAPRKSSKCSVGKKEPLLTENDTATTKVLSFRPSNCSNSRAKEKISPNKSTRPIMARPEQHTALDCRRVMRSIHRSGPADSGVQKAPQSARAVKKKLLDPRSSKSATELWDSSTNTISPRKSLHPKPRHRKAKQLGLSCDAHTQTVWHTSTVSTLTECEYADSSSQTDAIAGIEPLQCLFVPIQLDIEAGTKPNDNESAFTALRKSPCTKSPIRFGPWSPRVLYSSCSPESVPGDKNVFLNNSKHDFDLPRISPEANNSPTALTGDDQLNLLDLKNISEVDVKRTVAEVVSVSGKTNFFLVSSPQKNCITTRISPVRMHRPFFRWITTETSTGVDGEDRKPSRPVSPLSSPSKGTPKSPEHAPFSRIGAISPVLELDEASSSNTADKIKQPRPQRKFHRRRLEHCQIDDVACEYPTFSEKCSPIVIPHPEAIDEQANVVFVDMKARRLEEIIKLAATRDRTTLPTAAAKCRQQSNRELEHSESSRSTSTTGHYVGSTEGTEEHAVALESEPQSLEDDD